MKQAQALALLQAGHNVLLTGAAGSGKTYVLQAFIDAARKNGKVVAVTATTGLAATHLSGSTIHSWSGMGVHERLEKRLIDSLKKQRTEAILRTNILIIDEISMLHDYRLDLLDELLRFIRSSERPFGGLQVVLCGDFFQLPPVNRSGAKSGGFVVRSRVWQEAGFKVCYLEEAYRQKDDAVFASLLNALRANQFNEDHYDRLQGRMQVFNDPFEPKTKLYTTNADVDLINQLELAKINGEMVTYEMETGGTAADVATLKKNCLAQELLTLKKGALVMCIKNSPDKKYVNGSLGSIVAFEPKTRHPVVQLMNGTEVVIKPDTWELHDGERSIAQLVQIPLRLAWAITVHKSQGMTLDAVEVDLSRAFTPGMGYVALSRVRTLNGLYIAGLNAMALRVSGEALELEEYLQKASLAAEALAG